MSTESNLSALALPLPFILFCGFSADRMRRCFVGSRENGGDSKASGTSLSDVSSSIVRSKSQTFVSVQR